MDVVPGELTDDSRMMLDLAESILGPGGADLNELGRRFVAWMDEEPKDIGNTTRLAIQLLKDGTPWTEAGQRALDDPPAAAALGLGYALRRRAGVAGVGLWAAAEPPLRQRRPGRTA